MKERRSYMKVYMKEYYLNNRKRIIDYNLSRYDKLISGRLNPTENKFNKGVFVISFK